MYARFLVMLLFTLLGGCTNVHNADPSEAAIKRHTLLLISIDGARHDYLDRGATPTLSALAAGGARADRLIPSFPTLTFPNHYTLVTGLHPDHHGVVHNTMRDDSRPGEVFSLSNVAARDGFWWDEAEPLWVTAERAGLRTATMFWPGSEAPIRGVRPSRWYTFSKHISSRDRAEQVIAWLNEPASTRPDLITIYFDVVDTAGHDHGPDAPEVHAALREVDDALAAIRSALAQRAPGDGVNILIVSDHGMSALSDDRVVYLDDLADPDSFNVESWGVCAFIRPRPGREPDAQRLLGEHPHVSIWRKSDIPARFHFGAHPRVAPIVALAEPGWSIALRSSKRAGPRAGTHGYDHEAPDMAGIFIAAGPDIRPGARIDTLHAVDVHPLALRLLGLPDMPSDGAVDASRSILRR